MRMIMRDLLIAPAFMLRPQEVLNEIFIDLFGAFNLYDVWLVVNFHFVRAVVRDVKAEANACMRIAVMAPEQKIVPVAAEAQ